MNEKQGFVILKKAFPGRHVSVSKEIDYLKHAKTVKETYYAYVEDVGSFEGETLDIAVVNLLCRAVSTDIEED